MRHYVESQRLFRSTLRAKVSGVCAGIAAYFDAPVWLVRVATIMAFLLFPGPIALAYILAIFILPKR